MTTEAETLRQCVAEIEVAGDGRWVEVDGNPGHREPSGMDVCGEWIAQVGELWEHVDPIGECRECGHPWGSHTGTDRRGYGCRYCESDDVAYHESQPPVVKRGHQAIPGEER